MAKFNLKKYKDKQWKNPITIDLFIIEIWIYKGNEIYIPFFGIIFFKDIFYFERTHFHNGNGFQIVIKKIISIQICYKGKIGWWFKKGLFSIELFNKYSWRY
jgi:hypothetical protein